MSFWRDYFFNFRDAPSVWTHWSLRLWWQQHLSLYNLLLPSLCLLWRSWIMLFHTSSKQLACITSLQSGILPIKPLMQPQFTSSTAPSFIFEIFEANKIEIWIWNNIEKKVNYIHLGLIYCLNLKFKWILVHSLCLQVCPVSLCRILTNEHWYVKMQQMILLHWRNEKESVCSVK